MGATEQRKQLSVVERIARTAAEEQARIAESRRLAAESSSALAKYPQRGLLLAVEAVRLVQPLEGVRVLAAEQSLREALGSVGGRHVVPTKSVVGGAGMPESEQKRREALGHLRRPTAQVVLELLPTLLAVPEMDCSETIAKAGEYAADSPQPI